ncbi:hypothetical protein SDC9_105365 [bioreactor metagenome]|uniref:Uncharacterized protein n=1 Tax=bioreactor metagenome TaxID=1076179 RepID=A0A645BA28_9ZZZZ
MLFLICADGNELRLIDQDIRRHEYGIGEEPRVDILRVLCALFLKLRHARELAHIGVAHERPGQLRMLRHMALNEDRGAVRIDSCGEKQRKSLDAAPSEFGCVHAHRLRVQVCDHIICVKLVLHGDKILQCAKVIAYG